jgi:hypothetical protein
MKAFEHAANWWITLAKGQFLYDWSIAASAATPHFFLSLVVGLVMMAAAAWLLSSLFSLQFHPAQSEEIIILGFKATVLCYYWATLWHCWIGLGKTAKVFEYMQIQQPIRLYAEINQFNTIKGTVVQDRDWLRIMLLDRSVFGKDSPRVY